MNLKIVQPKCKMCIVILLKLSKVKLDVFAIDLLAYSKEI